MHMGYGLRRKKNEKDTESVSFKIKDIVGTYKYSELIVVEISNYVLVTMFL